MPYRISYKREVLKWHPKAKAVQLLPHLYGLFLKGVEINKKTGRPYYFPDFEGGSQLQVWRKAYFSIHGYETPQAKNSASPAPAMQGERKKSTWKEGKFMPSRVCSSFRGSEFKKIDQKKLIEFCACPVSECDIMESWQAHFKAVGTPYAVTEHPPGERSSEAMLVLWKEKRV